MNTKAFIVFLIVSLSVAAVVVLVYAKKHPNPYFRPKKGEVFMMSLLMVLFSVTASFIASQAFNTDFDLQKSKKEKDQAEKGYKTGDGTKPSNDSSDTDEPAPKVDDTLPPFLQDAD